VHDDCAAAPELRPLHDAGWAHFLGCLAALAEGRPVTRRFRPPEGGARSHRTIELETTVQAPADAVFRALTDAGELARWFASSAESDPRSGGEFSYRFEFDDPARNHTYSGRYLEVVPGEHVAYPWQGALGETRVDVRLERAGDATRVHLTHSGWGEGAGWDEAVELHRQGWRGFLANLESVLERGEDVRARVMGMRARAAV
jgi:uncharacterized protein YndB with AHSA1/START domain